MEKLQLLESVLGQGQHTNRDYYQFMCPFHIGRNGPKLGISLNNGNWKCWVCGAKGSTVSNLLFKLNVEQSKRQEAKKLWKERVQIEEKEVVPEIMLPNSYISLSEQDNSFFYNRAKNYVLKRGLTEKDIIKHQIGYCEWGEWSGYLIFPVYNDGKLIYYSGRAYEPFKDPHKLPKYDKDFVGDEWLVNWNEDIILVESKLNAITVRRNAVPMYGKTLSKKLKLKIVESSFETIYIALDGDATNDISEIADFCLQNGKRVKQIILPKNQDINDIGFAEFWKLFDHAIEIKEQNTFELELKKLLKLE
jgi:DNA primase